MDISRRTILRGSAAMALGAVAPGAVARASSRHGQDISFPVTLGAMGAVVTGRMHSARGQRYRGLIVCVPGFSYAAYYWDFPARGDNFAAALTACGWEVLTLNRPGTEPSTGFPPADVLTVTDEADALHQVIGKARAPSPYPLILAGHSLGSSIALEAATVGGIDGLILSGFSHTPSAAGRALAAGNVMPAPHRPAGYLTTRPGTRASVFLQADVSPAMTAADERLKTTGTGGELAGIAPSLDPALSSLIHVPVLIANGTADIISYGPGMTGTVAGTAAAEAPYWKRPPDVWLLDGAPHSINFARNARDWFRTAARFADRLAR